MIPVLPTVSGPFSHHSLGSRPTKQLASMGIPGPARTQTPPSLLYLSSSLQLAPGERRPSLFSPRWSLWGGGEAPATDLLGAGP